jgi:F420-dependent oxidoreductase-like protein
MQLRVFTEPQLGAVYDDLLAVARRAEECGFDAFFRSDHFLSMGTYNGLPGPTDAWVTLAGIARETVGIRIGTLVSAATFRLPGLLAVTVAQVDQMSGGRVELGLGAGWFEAEHRAYGVPFPPAAQRFERLEEQLEIVTGLWGTPVGKKFSFHGQHYELADAPALPKPMQQPGPPIIVGGWGTRRTPALAARFADEYNVPFGSVADAAAQFERVQAACAALPQPRATPIRLSAAQTVCCGRSDAEVRRRAEAIHRDPDALRESGVCGTPDEVVARLREFAAVGVERMYLQVLDLADLDQLDLIAAEVMPHVPDP